MNTSKHSRDNLVDNCGEKAHNRDMTTTQTPEVRNYSLLAANGRKIRTATMVVFVDGTEVRFTERMSKREALRQATTQRPLERANAIPVHDYYRTSASSCFDCGLSQTNEVHAS